MYAGGKWLDRNWHNVLVDFFEWSDFQLVLGISLLVHDLYCQWACTNLYQNNKPNSILKSTHIKCHVTVGIKYIACVLRCSVVSSSLRPCGLSPARQLCLWDSPGKSTEVGSHSLLQGIFSTQRWNPGPLHCRWSFTIWAIGYICSYWKHEDLWQILVSPIF